jgi:hypothetical protein
MVEELEQQLITLRLEVVQGEKEVERLAALITGEEKVIAEERGLLLSNIDSNHRVESFEVAERNAVNNVIGEDAVRDTLTRLENEKEKVEEGSTQSHMLPLNEKEVKAKGKESFRELLMAREKEDVLKGLISKEEVVKEALIKLAAARDVEEEKFLDLTRRVRLEEIKLEEYANLELGRIRTGLSPRDTETLQQTSVGPTSFKSSPSLKHDSPRGSSENLQVPTSSSSSASTPHSGVDSSNKEKKIYGRRDRAHVSSLPPSSSGNILKR